MTASTENRIKGQAVSRGVATGPAVCLYGHRRQYFRNQLLPGQAEKEIHRFRAAVRLSIKQVDKLASRDSGRSDDNKSGILEFHQMLLSDPLLLKQIEEKIITDQVNAEWAVKQITDMHLAEYKAIADENLRERHIDLEDVAERILAALGGGHKNHSTLNKGSIVISRDLNPSTLIELSGSEIAGIVTEHGGWTSHTFILARELGIPAVTGVSGLLQRIQMGDQVVVDGFRGEIIIRPSDEYPGDLRSNENHHSFIDNTSSGPSMTVDGRQIIIRANADISGGFEKASAAGALGVGLFRSEYIFNRFTGVPSEDEQFEAYRKIALATADHGVRIRTFDFGSDDLGDHNPPKSKNPSLGLRAIRLSLDHEKQFRDQLRALLRASHQTSLDIILPMISDIGEISQVKSLLEEERQGLKANNIMVGDPRLGVMVEVPSTVLMIDEILSEVDTICLGTNDLVQYLLAVDRDNESVARWFRTLSPAVIKAVQFVIEACSKRNKPCVICGEMAGSPYYVPLLIGLGATELSMNPNSIPRIANLISKVAYDEALMLARSVQKCVTADDAERTNREFIAKRWAHLYDSLSAT
jgi:phosphotransferase system enzyme I (PtsI)